MAILEGQAILGTQHFDPTAFDALIDSHGITIRLFRGIVCACVKPDRGAPDPSCTVCFGRGAHYYEAVPIVTKVYATRRLQRQAERAGGYMPGVSDYTFQTAILAKLYDKFEILNDVIVVDELLVRGETNPLTSASREILRFETIVAIERAEYVQRSPSAGAPYTSAAVPLVEGVDFTRSGRAIVWPVTPAIPDGTIYSIRYQTNAVWVVWSPRQRAEDDVRMPPTYECRRLDFVERAQGDET